MQQLRDDWESAGAGQPTGALATRAASLGRALTADNKALGKTQKTAGTASMIEGLQRRMESLEGQMSTVSAVSCLSASYPLLTDPFTAVGCA